MRGDVISIFDHHSNERLDLNVRVGMTADACSGPFSRSVRESPLRLASSVFTVPWSNFLQKIKLEIRHMKVSKNL